MYEQVLTRVGLNEKQAKVYLACLELGKSKAPEIAKKANLKRTTTYDILDQLVIKGLISYTQQGKAKLFTPEDPEAILHTLESGKQELIKILPKLQNLTIKHNIQPRIKFYEGKQGVKQVLLDSLSCKSKKILQVVKTQDFVKFPGGAFTAEYIKQRAGKGIVAYALHPKGEQAIDRDIYAIEDPRRKRHVRFLPPSVFYASAIVIYDNKVSMVSTAQENFGFIIESKEFSKTLQAWFWFMWGLGSKER